MIVFGAIAPHGGEAFVDGSATWDGFAELGRRLEAAAPDSIVVVTPHNVHVEGHFGVVVATSVVGAVEEVAVELACETDVALAERLLRGLREADLPALALRFAAAAPDVAVIVTPHSVHVDGHFAVVTAGNVGEWETDAEVVAALLEAPLPVLGVSYGGNDPATAEFPLDWGTEMPLEFLRPPRIVVVSPARDRPLEEHLRLGEAIAALPGRVALVASADHGHAHDVDGPFGFDPAAAEYDELAVELVRENRLDRLGALERLVEAAKADSLWQLAILHGALGDGFGAELLSYDVPTYFGMLCAAFTTE